MAIKNYSMINSFFKPFKKLTYTQYTIKKNIESIEQQIVQ